MNENDRGSRPGAPATDDGIGDLIRSAGRRPAIPDDDLAALEEAARSAWRRMAAMERRKRLRLRSAYALAASLLIALAGAWWLWPDRAPAIPEEIATVELTTGRVEAVRGGGAGPGESLAAGDSLSAGVVLETGKEGVVVSTGDGRLLVRKVHLQDASRMDAHSFVIGHDLKVGHKFT